MKSITNNEPEKESTGQRRSVTETIQKANMILDADFEEFIGMKSSVFGRNSHFACAQSIEKAKLEVQTTLQTNLRTGMHAAIFNIQIRELDVGKLRIDLRKGVYHGKRIV